MKTLLSAVWFTLLCLPCDGGQSPQVPPFRTRTVLVPIDVRVLDRNGRPVTDLTRDDFTVLEDGIPQKITLFEGQALTPIAVDPRVPLLLRPAAGASLTFQTRRVFLIMLATHRRLWLVSEHFGAAEAITRFIRERLFPQDYVAVAAWNRATEFTADHEEAAQVVERLRTYQDTIERSRKRQPKAAELYRSRVMPISSETQAEIDAVFQTRSSAARTVAHGPTLEVRNLLEEIENHIWSRSSQVARHVAMQWARETTQTVAGEVLDIASGIHYLRHIEGEKHLVYVAPHGLWLPAVDDDKSLARIASDARVVIDVIQTGGLPQYDEFGRPGAGRVNLETSMASKHLSELTGGLASFNEYPEHAFTQIDVATRSGYLLAYYPSNPSLDGRHRKLSVRVSRPRGGTVLSRRSYLAQPEATPYDYREFVIQDRIMTAAQFDSQIQDVKVLLVAASRGGVVAMDVVIDPTQLAFDHTTDDRRTASVNIAFFCADARERPVGELWERLDLNLRAETYQQALREGLRHTATVPVKGTARFVKVVVYEYASDRTGATIVRLGDRNER